MFLLVLVLVLFLLLLLLLLLGCSFSSVLASSARSLSRRPSFFILALWLVRLLGLVWVLVLVLAAGAGAGAAVVVFLPGEVRGASKTVPDDCRRDRPVSQEHKGHCLGRCPVRGGRGLRGRRNICSLLRGRVVGSARAFVVERCDCCLSDAPESHREHVPCVNGVCLK